MLIKFTWVDAIAALGTFAATGLLMYFKLWHTSPFADEIIRELTLPRRQVFLAVFAPLAGGFLALTTILLVRSWRGQSPRLNLLGQMALIWLLISFVILNINLGMACGFLPFGPIITGVAIWEAKPKLSKILLLIFCLVWIGFVLVYAYQLLRLDPL